MPRQASFDVESFRSQILDTILNSPVALSRREIFDRCGFDNDNGAYLSAFDRFIKRETTQALVDCRGDKKNRVYIAINPPILTEPEPEPSPVTVSEPVAVPVESFGQSLDSQGRLPAQNLHREKPPKPPFTMQAISDASEVTGALKVLSDASGAERLVALGVDKREADRDPAFGMMTMNYGDVPLPVRQMILAAGDVVYDFDVGKIHQKCLCNER